MVGNDLTIFSRPSVYSRCGFAYLPKSIFNFFSFFLCLFSHFCFCFRFPGAFFHGGSGGSIGLGDWKEEMGLFCCFEFIFFYFFVLFILIFLLKIQIT